MRPYLRCLVALLFVAILEGCDTVDSPSQQSADSPSQQSSDASSQQTAEPVAAEKDLYSEPAKGPLIPYFVLGSWSGPARYGTLNPDSEAGFEIQVDLVNGRFPTDLELVAIAWALRKTKPIHGHTIVNFFLPDMETNAGGIATADIHPKCIFQWHHTNIPEQYSALVPPEEITDE